MRKFFPEPNYEALKPRQSFPRCKLIKIIWLEKSNSYIYVIKMLKSKKIIIN